MKPKISNQSQTYQHPRVNVDFHVVGVVKSIVAQIHKMVEEENYAQEGHKLGQPFRFPVQRSKLGMSVVSFGRLNSAKGKRYLTIMHQKVARTIE